MRDDGPVDETPDDAGRETPGLAAGPAPRIPIPILRRTVLLVAAINLSYFLIEGGVALVIRSVSLLADRVDFLEDTAVNLLVALALGWSIAARAAVGRALAIVILIPAIAVVVQLVLNALWSPLFFALYPAIGVTAMWLSLTVHLLLLVAITTTIVEFWPIHRVAALIMVPYLVWVVFAASLTVSIAVIN